MNSLKVLVIGGDSFIAGNFIREYSDRLHITPVSRKSTGFENEILTMDFFNVDDLLFQTNDVLINFAAIVHQPNIKSKKLYSRINYELPLFLANKARNGSIRQFIQFSSVAIYGNATHIYPSSPYNPTTLYGTYKLAADLSLRKFDSDDFKVMSVRPSMVYGGGQAPGNMMRLINLVKKRVPLPFKNISNYRQNLHINNLTWALYKIIHKSMHGEILIADEAGISTSELVSLISRILNMTDLQFKAPVLCTILKIFKSELMKKLLNDLRIDNSYSFRELDLTQASSIESGIMEMIAK